MVFAANNKIAVEIEYIVKGQDRIDKVNADLKKIGEGPIGKLQKASFADRKETALRVQSMRKGEAATKKQNQANAKAAMGLYGVIGAMFLLSAVSAAILGAFQPAFDAAGILELIGVILLVMFLPAALVLIPILLMILKWVLAMPKELKIFIGIALLVVAIIFIIVGAFIAFLLAIAGLVVMLISLGAGAGEAALAVGAIVAVFLAITALAAGVAGAVAAGWDKLNSPSGQAAVKSAVIQGAVYSIPMIGQVAAGASITNMIWNTINNAGKDSGGNPNASSTPSTT